MRRIAGGSMRPGLPPGRIVIAVRYRRLPQVGDVVIVRYNGEENIKRVHYIQDTQMYVLGDDQEMSTDSRSFGWLSQSAMCGIVIWPRVADR